MFPEIDIQIDCGIFSRLEVKCVNGNLRNFKFTQPGRRHILRDFNPNAAAAGTPGSPGFRSVQPESIFQRVVKPALRATVSVVCAGSIAIQSVMVSGYAQTPPGPPSGPNTTLTNWADGRMDVTVAPNACDLETGPTPNNPQCPVNNPLPSPSNVELAFPQQAGPPTIIVNDTTNPPTTTNAGPAAAIEVAGQALQSGAGEHPETSQANKPWYAWPTVGDGHEFFYWQMLTLIAFLGHPSASYAWDVASATTDDANYSELHKKFLPRLVGASLTGLGMWAVNTLRIWIWLFTYYVAYKKYLKNVPKKKPNETEDEKKKREEAEQQADLDARAICHIVLVAWASVIWAASKYSLKTVDKWILENNGIGDINNRRRLLANDPDPRKTVRRGPTGSLMAEFGWNIQQIKVINRGDGKKEYWLPPFRSLNIPMMAVTVPREIDYSGNQMKLPVDLMYPVGKDTGWYGMPPAGVVMQGIRRPKDFVINPATLTQRPTKFVADGRFVWMLSGRGKNGYYIYKRPQYKDPASLGEDGENWKKINGQVIDLFPGQHYVWAVNSEEDIFTCKQPCDTGEWIKIPGQARNIAVGPWYRATYKTTAGNSTRVWMITSEGKIYSRPETNVDPNDKTWMSHYNPNGGFFGSVPKLIRELLYERPGKLDWSHPERYNLPYHMAK